MMAMIVKWGIDKDNDSNSMWSSDAYFIIEFELYSLGCKGSICCLMLLK